MDCSTSHYKLIPLLAVLLPPRLSRMDEASKTTLKKK